MKTYFIKTFGCQMNCSDSERIEAFLESNDFEPAEDLDQADLVVFNTCGVRQTAEDRVYGQVHNLRKKNEKVFIIVTGCLAHRKDVQKKLKDKVDLFISIGNFFNIIPFEKRGRFAKINPGDSKKNKKRLKILPSPPLKKKGTNDYLNIQPKYKDAKRVLVPIMTGCNNFCSYCVVPYARGREKSRPVMEIASEIEKLDNNSYREILLLGQNVNSYRFANRESKFVNRKTNHTKQTTNFSQLLDFLATKYPRLTFSFLTSHPKDFSDELIDVIAHHQNVSREIHLPIQSGSDKVLKDMNRPYTQQHYLKLIDKIFAKIPEAKVTTDVIVGFPTETEKEFQETVKVFQKVPFANAYINKYSPRPGTVAFQLGDPIPWQTKKKREKILRQKIKN